MENNPVIENTESVPEKKKVVYYHLNKEKTGYVRTVETESEDETLPPVVKKKPKRKRKKKVKPAVVYKGTDDETDYENSACAMPPAAAAKPATATRSKAREPEQEIQEPFPFHLLNQSEGSKRLMKLVNKDIKSMTPEEMAAELEGLKVYEAERPSLEEVVSDSIWKLLALFNEDGTAKDKKPVKLKPLTEAKAKWSQDVSETLTRIFSQPHLLTDDEIAKIHELKMQKPPSTATDDDETDPEVDRIIREFGLDKMVLNDSDSESSTYDPTDETAKLKMINSKKPMDRLAMAFALALRDNPDFKIEDLPKLWADKKPNTGTRQRKFNCNFCSFSARTDDDLRLHLAKIHGEKIPVKGCDKCSFETTYIHVYRKHLQNHVQPQLKKRETASATATTLQCPYCDYVAKFPSHLKQHIETHLASEQKSFRCNYDGCSYSNSLKSNLKAHMGSKHGDQKYLKRCPHCEYSTAKSNNLKSHIERHLPSEQRRYPCTFDGCEFGASRKAHLTAHLASKHKQTQHLKQCPHCDYTTGHSSALKNHIETHLSSGEKSFLCSYEGCSYVANRKSFLSAHLGTIHGEILHLKQCPHCNYATGQLSNLNTHIKKLHKSI